jgi:hypothetical protein
MVCTTTVFKLYPEPSLLADKYDAQEFLGFLDADPFFVAAVHPSELFDYDIQNNRWHPRVIGCNGCCTPAWAYTTKYVLRQQEKAGEFMVFIGFLPKNVKTKHLAYVQECDAELVVGASGDAAFVQVFNKVCHLGIEYSQFNIIFNILWHLPYPVEY